MTNNLINETSPYLLQHKNNPVDWFPWNPKTLGFIKAQEKPVLLSIGYSSCHWCHVMAHESFENPEIAGIMNSCFVNIKVDREERPDVDALYQAALNLMGQQGGWPLTMFLDNNLKPFWGGTYFPETPRHGMPSFPDILNHIHTIYSKHQDRVFNNSKAISEALKKIYYSKTDIDYSFSDIVSFLNVIDDHFDSINGGLTGAPKFPMVPLLRAITSICALDNNFSFNSLNNIKISLDSLCLGGIYDHLGGGFSRYSTDAYWLVPHFEKMLYDNAQLIEVLSSFSFLRKSPLYLDRVKKTISWLRKDMLYSENNSEAYYSSMDADSEGKEGEYYVWKYSEIKDTLLNDSENFIKQYGIEKNGNWEGKNILHRINKNKDSDLVFEYSKKNILNIEKLLRKREGRLSPSVDYKILTDWNSMLICGFLKAYIATEEQDYLKMAEKIYSFIINNHFVNNELYHSSCNGVLGSRGLLDDYANFIKACFLLYEADEDINKLKNAKRLILLVKENFFDTAISGFYFSSKEGGDLFLKTTNKLDGPTQSGSSIMLENLIKNYYYFGNVQDLSLVDLLIKGSWSGVKKNIISSMGYISAAYIRTAGYNFVALIKNDVFGKEVKKYLLKLSSFSILTFFYNEGDIPENSAIGKKRYINGGSTVYICKGFVCSPPFININQLKNWIKNNIKNI